MFSRAGTKRKEPRPLCDEVTFQKVQPQSQNLTIFDFSWISICRVCVNASRCGVDGRQTNCSRRIRWEWFETSRAVPRRKFPSEVPKRKYPSESFQANVSQRKFLSGSFQAQVPKRSSTSGSSQANLQIESFQAEVSGRSLPNQVSKEPCTHESFQTKNPKRLFPERILQICSFQNFSFQMHNFQIFTLRKSKFQF